MTINVQPLRGKTSAFNILVPQVRSRWAARFAGADLVVVDCLRPFLDALGLSEDKDAGRFLEALDELTTEAGIDETLVVHHMGHNNERSRGDSRILDWPDAVWKLVSDHDDRYFSAYGRDVAQGELRLGFEPLERRLAIEGGSRRDRRLDDAFEEIREVLVAASEPLSGRQVTDALVGSSIGRDTFRAALKRAVKDRVVLVEEGPRGAELHFLNPSQRASGRE